MSSQEGYEIKMIDIRKNQVVKAFSDPLYMNSHRDNKISWGPNEEWIIAGSSDTKIMAWNVLDHKVKS